MKIDVRSEIGELEGVILHAPGPEVENMTPENAERALYSDILNLSVAKTEYAQLKALLSGITRVFEIQPLLETVLEKEDVKHRVIEKICINENCMDLMDRLLSLPAKALAGQLIQGVVLVRDNLTRFLTKERFALRPLHNFFFTRDAAMALRDEVLIGKMAKTVRSRESIIMEAIFNHNASFTANTVNPADNPALAPEISIEGGDVLVARDDILVIGNGSRTTSQGIDFIIERLKKQKDGKRHIIVQELPHTPESFIHLDMVFTFLDTDTCMVFEPLVLKQNRYQTTHITIENGNVTGIREEKQLLDALSMLGMDLKPICCGGDKDLWTQEREQWHSGANFFAIAPGKVVGYGRNVHTVEELSKNGFEIIPANDIINHKTDLKNTNQCMITLDGSELPRGGGGARCMTMPVRRKSVNW